VVGGGRAVSMVVMRPGNRALPLARRRIN